MNPKLPIACNRCGELIRRDGEGFDCGIASCSNQLFLPYDAKHYEAYQSSKKVERIVKQTVWQRLRAFFKGLFLF